MSARNLSIKCGLSPSYISKVENGDLEPSYKSFVKISEVLEFTDKEILFLVKGLK